MYVLFPHADAKGNNASETVEQWREKVYAGLEDHCLQAHPNERNRFAKLLLRLPPLRSIGLKCPEQIFFAQLFPNLPIDLFLKRLLIDPHRNLNEVAQEVQDEASLMPPEQLDPLRFLHQQLLASASASMQSGFANNNNIAVAAAGVSSSTSSVSMPTGLGGGASSSSSTITDGGGSQTKRMKPDPGFN